MNKRQRKKEYKRVHWFHYACIDFDAWIARTSNKELGRILSRYKTPEDAV